MEKETQGTNSNENTTIKKNIAIQSDKTLCTYSTSMLTKKKMFHLPKTRSIISKKEKQKKNNYILEIYKQTGKIVPQDVIVNNENFQI